MDPGSHYGLFSRPSVFSWSRPLLHAMRDWLACRDIWLHNAWERREVGREASGLLGSRWSVQSSHSAYRSSKHQVGLTLSSSGHSAELELGPISSDGMATFFLLLLLFIIIIISEVKPLLPLMVASVCFFQSANRVFHTLLHLSSQSSHFLESEDDGFQIFDSALNLILVLIFGARQNPLGCFFFQHLRESLLTSNKHWFLGLKLGEDPEHSSQIVNRAICNFILKQLSP